MKQLQLLLAGNGFPSKLLIFYFCILYFLILYFRIFQFGIPRETKKVKGIGKKEGYGMAHDFQAKPPPLPSGIGLSLFKKRQVKPGRLLRPGIDFSVCLHQPDGGFCPGVVVNREGSGNKKLSRFYLVSCLYLRDSIPDHRPYDRSVLFGQKIPRRPPGIVRRKRRVVFPDRNGKPGPFYFRRYPGNFRELIL